MINWKAFQKIFYEVEVRMAGPVKFKIRVNRYCHGPKLVTSTSFNLLHTCIYLLAEMMYRQHRLEKVSLKDLKKQWISYKLILWFWWSLKYTFMLTSYSNILSNSIALFSVANLSSLSMLGFFRLIVGKFGFIFLRYFSFVVFFSHKDELADLFKLKLYWYHLCWFLCEVYLPL